MIESAVHMAKMDTDELMDTDEKQAPQNERESNERMREDGGWGSSMT